MAKNVKIQRDDEHVVHRQRLLDQEAGEVLHAAVGATQPGDPGAEEQAGTDVAGRQQQALTHADLLLALVEHAEVEGEQRGDDGDEGEPDPDRRAEHVGEEEGRREIHERMM